MGGPRRDRLALGLFWALALVAISIWISRPGFVVGWDLDVVRRCIVALRAGRDPYAESIAAQLAFFAGPARAGASPPFSYVYSPLTLPLLRWLGYLPFALSGSLYWTAYAAGVAMELWLGLRLAERRERQTVALLAPFALFFPGLLENDVLFSGNIAFLLYPCVFAAAWAGWRRGQWRWFYLAALVASCFKPPMLTVLAIPILSARKQLIPSCLAGAFGLALFGIQPLLYPNAFRSFLHALHLMFSLQHDFSGSPAGLLAEGLYGRAPYPVIVLVSYLLTGIPVFCLLRWLARRYFAGELGLRQWVPVMLLGVMLLNPRILEYDVAALTLPMAEVAWRVFARNRPASHAACLLTALFVVVNVSVAVVSPSRPLAWKTAECLLLVGLFLAGSWNLLLELRDMGKWSAGDAPAVVRPPAQPRPVRLG